MTRECIECNAPESESNPLRYETHYIGGQGYITVGPLCSDGYACGMRYWGIDAYAGWTPPGVGEIRTPDEVFLADPLTEADGADTAHGAERWLRGEREVAG